MIPEKKSYDSTSFDILLESLGYKSNQPLACLAPQIWVTLTWVPQYCLQTLLGIPTIAKNQRVEGQE